MKKVFLAVVMIILALTKTAARQLTPEEALCRLQTASEVKGMMESKTKDTSKYNLAYSSQKNGLNTYYAFNGVTDGGFIILSADDCLPAILMISDEGETFDINKIPDNMKWWLSQYDETIVRCVNEGTQRTTQTEYESITPLLGGTQWTELEPYNNFCPSYNGIKAPTGCVATAMAQVMRKWQYPKTGIGKKKYDYTFTWSDNSTIYEIAACDSTDFSAHTYDWSNMLDTYQGGYTQEEADAVATLMHDCGVAASMRYSSDSSGTTGSNFLSGMVDYFGYDASASLLPRLFFTDEEWEEKVYDELAAGRPVLYSGIADGTEGHMFVCDGYREGRYHINWGWGEMFNGYVLLTSSSPEEPPLSCKDSNGRIYGSYYSGQAACFGLKPDAGGTINEDNKMLCRGQYFVGEINTDTWTLDKKTDFTRDQTMEIVGNFYNACYRERCYAFGAKASNGKNTFYMNSYLSFDLNPTESYFGYSVSLTDILTPGEYTITPIFKDLTAGDTEWKEMTMSSAINKPTVTILEFTSANQPYLKIIEKPVISTAGGPMTPDNQVYMKNGAIDLSISLTVNALNDLGYAEYYLNNQKHSEPHYLYAYIQDSDTYEEIAVMHCECGAIPSGATRTFVLSSSDDDYESINLFEVGKQYCITFTEAYRIVLPNTNYTEETLPDYIWQYLPDTQYQTMTFTVVESNPTDIKNISDGNDTANGTNMPRKLLKNGRFIISHNGKEYSADGMRIK